MSEGPYRPDPLPDSEADAELARIAAQGQRRILDANAAGASQAAATAHVENSKPDINVRLALGAYYGTPLRTASLVLVGVGMLAIPGGFGRWLGVTDLGAVGVVAGIVTLIVGLCGANVVKRLAPRARVDAERAWARSLPFVLEHYFELLAADPPTACRLVIELTWATGQMPALETVRGVFGLWDAGVAVEPGDGRTIHVRGSPFECGFWDFNDGREVFTRLYGRQPVYRVHRVIDTALLPLHRSHAIARVSVGHEVVPGPAQGQKFLRHEARRSAEKEPACQGVTIVAANCRAAYPRGY